MNKGIAFTIGTLSLAALLLQASPALSQSISPSPTFYHDVQPILEKHCQNCHRPGEMAFPLITYNQAAPRARVIAESAVSKKMPPWLADPNYGRFANDPSLTMDEIKLLSTWAKSGAHAGNPRDMKPAPHMTNGWNISAPDDVIEMPKAITLARKGDIDYTYEIVPTHFREDRWVQMAELRPTSRDHVHHGVVYIRPPDS
jgi:hypothetical protein